MNLQMIGRVLLNYVTGRGHFGILIVLAWKILHEKWHTRQEVVLDALMVPVVAVCGLKRLGWDHGVAELAGIAITQLDIVQMVYLH